MKPLSPVTQRAFLCAVMLGWYGVSLVSPAHAQFSSAIEGVVTDQSGAAVPNATIDVTNQATNIKYEGTSTSTGSFRVPALPPGTYRIDVQETGFRVWTQTDLILEPNKVRTVNPELHIGEQVAAVLVQASATAVETAKSDSARTVSTGSISDAPMSQRNIYTSLAALAPGITGTGTDLGNTATATADN
jgi:hypothetical protein